MQPEIIQIANEETIEQLDYDKKVMAEEVLHKNPDAKILPTKPIPKVLPPISIMEPIFHKTCKQIAFYYTHVPEKREMMTATRARDIDGKTIEPGAPMICGSCKLNVGLRNLMVRPRDE